MEPDHPRGKRIMPARNYRTRLDKAAEGFKCSDLPRELWPIIDLKMQAYRPVSERSCDDIEP